LKVEEEEAAQKMALAVKHILAAMVVVLMFSLSTYITQNFITLPSHQYSLTILFILI